MQAAGAGEGLLLLPMGDGGGLQACVSR